MFLTPLRVTVLHLVLFSSPVTIPDELDFSKSLQKLRSDTLLTFARFSILCGRAGRVRRTGIFGRVRVREWVSPFRRQLSLLSRVDIFSASEITPVPVVICSVLILFSLIVCMVKFNKETAQDCQGFSNTGHKARDTARFGVAVQNLVKHAY
ncbi:hypothetical protein PG989_014664 [Apiospora arundinis]